jgi:hypothetical protein
VQQPHDQWRHDLKPEHFDDELAVSQSLQYLLRLNPPTLELVNGRLREPTTQRLRETLSRRYGRGVLSLPIRGSDKCGEEMMETGGDGKHRHSMLESSCLPWSGYLDALNSVRQYDSNVNTVLVTSEDIRYINLAKKHAAALARNGSRSFHFVFNERDVSPGSGHLSKHTARNPEYMKQIHRRMGHSPLNVEQVGRSSIARATPRTMPLSSHTGPGRTVWPRNSSCPCGVRWCCTCMHATCCSIAAPTGTTSSVGCALRAAPPL